MDRIHTDIVISGGGVAGLAAAVAFGAAGFDVIVVDPAPPVTDAAQDGADLRTTAFLQPAKAFLDRAGLWEALAPYATALDVMRIVDAAKEPATTRDFVADDISDAPFGWNLPNWLLRRVMVDRIAQMPNVTLRTGTGFASMVARLDQALTDFSDITGTVSAATDQISRFTNRLDGLSAALTQTLTNADTTLAAVTRTFDSADTVLTDAAPAVAATTEAITSVRTMLRDDVPAILADMAATAAQARAAITDLHNRSGQALDGLAATPDLLNARLTELQQSLVDASTAFAAVTEASDSFNTLVYGDGTLMVAEARDVLATAQRTMTTIAAITQDDVPAVVADIRTAVATATAAVDRVATDITGATSRLDPLATTAEATLTAARDLVVRAQGSLDGLDTTLTGANGALASAQVAFDSATGLMQTDLAPVITDIRTAADRISTAADQVAGDAPAITADLRALIARADAVVAQVQGAVASSAPGIGTFATTGLPELARLAADARGLVTSLDTLVRRIAQDPARFILDDRVPEYRR